MKKIIIASNTSWFIFNFFRASITEFMADKCKVFIVAPKDEYTQKLIDLGCIHLNFNISRSGMNVFKEGQTFLRLYFIYNKISPDILLNFTPKINIYSTIAAKLCGIPVINSVAGLGSIFTEKGPKAWFGKALLKVTQPLANHIIFQNNDDWNVYLDHGYVKKCNSSRVNGIGINLKRFKPYEAKNDDVVRFILVARMIYSKGVAVFVNAAKRVQSHYAMQALEGKSVPNFEFSLLGFVDKSHPQSIPLKQLKTWDEETLVNYLGSTQDVFSIVKEQDCVVLPSFYREGIPQCLIEAAAMAKPIITTDNVGCRETVLDNQSGFLVKPLSVLELKDAMIRMIELSHETRLELGRTGRKFAVKNFCHLKVSQHYLRTIECLLTDKSDD